jgi:hypothetical protein
MSDTQALLLQFGPTMLIQAIYAVIVYQFAKRQHIGPWAPTLGTLIPLIGFIVFLIFILWTQLRVLDRLNALEGGAAGQTFR